MPTGKKKKVIVEQYHAVCNECGGDGCDIEDYNELQARINKLQNELEDPWDDDDDDGDVPALIKR